MYPNRGGRAVAGLGTPTRGVHTSPRNYTGGALNSSVWKHNLNFRAIYPGAGSIITVNTYALLPLAKFDRTNGGTADVPPTPVSGTNNYATQKVFNGSRIANFNTVVNFRPEDSTAVYIDVYMIACSFHDITVWNTILPTACPLTVVQTVGAVNGGEPSEKTPAIGLVDETTIKDSSFVNHYIKKVGTLAIPATTQGGDPTSLVITDKDLPSKVRKSNTGMWYGLAFSNPGSKNNGASINVGIWGEISFDEIPSSNRSLGYPG